MIEWSGETWYERSDGYAMSVDVIEHPERRKPSKRQRKRQKKAKRMPFGFARALPKQKHKR
jgi:hypothetical protein